MPAYCSMIIQYANNFNHLKLIDHIGIELYTVCYCQITKQNHYKSITSTLSRQSEAQVGVFNIVECFYCLKRHAACC